MYSIITLAARIKFIKMTRCFEIIAEAKNSKARAGKLKTPHGTVETPFFMPVATKCSTKHVTSNELVRSGARALISNAFILSLRPGVELIEKAGSIHKFMNYPHTIFTDCGGFQMICEGFKNNAVKKGISFKSPFDGKIILLTPEKIMEIQSRLGSDVQMTLDDLAHHGESKKRFEEALVNTHRWAAESVEAHKKFGRLKGQLVFGIYQGGTFSDLRVKSAKFINKLDVDGISIGGYCIGEPKEKMFEGLKASLPYIDRDKPRYLMGVGSPLEILDAVSLGVDIFDSIYPTKTGRHGHLFTSKGVINIKLSKYKNDLSQLDEKCDCPVCKSFTKAYLHHLMKQKEPTGFMYRSYHNTHFLQNLMCDIRAAIKDGIFEKYKKEFIFNYSEKDQSTFVETKNKKTKKINNKKIKKENKIKISAQYSLLNTF